MIAVLGARGMLGHAVVAALGDQVLPLTRQEVALDSPDLALQLDALPWVSAFVNVAAYTHVDEAECHEALATLVDGHALGVLATWCRTRGIPLCHFSTDYVFDGGGDRPWVETDQRAPLNAYGRSKMLGEDYVMASGCRYWLFRVQWLYGPQGRHFVDTIRRLLHASADPLSVVNDQWGCPTPTGYLASVVTQCVQGGVPHGLYHLTGSQPVTWYQVAQAIATHGGHTDRVFPVFSDAMPRPARRPCNGRLSMAKAHSVGIPTFDWHQSLIDYLSFLN